MGYIMNQESKVTFEPVALQARRLLCAHQGNECTTQKERKQRFSGV